MKEAKYISSALLGKINIPQFSGDINDWVIFKNLIHDFKQLSNVEKMYRLVNSQKRKWNDKYEDPKIEILN